MKYGTFKYGEQKYSGTYIKQINASVSASSKIKRSILKVISALVSALGIWKYFRPVYPKLSYIEYPVEMSYTEYPIEMEVVGMAKSGSTITLTGKFPDSAGDLMQLEDVTAKVYAPGKVLLETIPATEISTGVYSAEYTIPEDKFGQFDYEFSGKLGEKTIVGRSSFDSRWK